VTLTANWWQYDSYGSLALSREYIVSVRLHVNEIDMFVNVAYSSAESYYDQRSSSSGSPSLGLVTPPEGTR
jgi:hypothetical protein